MKRFTISAELVEQYGTRNTLRIRDWRLASGSRGMIYPPPRGPLESIRLAILQRMADDGRIILENDHA